VLLGFMLPLPAHAAFRHGVDRVRKVRRAARSLERMLTRLEATEFAAPGGSPWSFLHSRFARRQMLLAAIAQSYKPGHGKVRRREAEDLLSSIVAPGAHFARTGGIVAWFARAFLAEPRAVRVIATKDRVMKVGRAWRRYHQEGSALRTMGLRVVAAGAACMAVPVGMMVLAGRPDEALANLGAVSTWVAIGWGVRTANRILVRVGLGLAALTTGGISVVLSGWVFLDDIGRDVLRLGLVACCLGALAASAGVGRAAAGLERVGAFVISIGLVVVGGVTLVDGWLASIGGSAADAYAGLAAGLGEFCIATVAGKVACFGASPGWRLWDRREGIARPNGRRPVAAG